MYFRLYECTLMSNFLTRKGVHTLLHFFGCCRTGEKARGSEREGEDTREAPEAAFETEIGIVGQGMLGNRFSDVGTMVVDSALFLPSVLSTPQFMLGFPCPPSYYSCVLARRTSLGPASSFWERLSCFPCPTTRGVCRKASCCILEV